MGFNAIAFISGRRGSIDGEIIIGIAGSLAGMAAGLGVALLCAWRERKPYAFEKMRFNMEAVLAVELALVFLSSFILDRGVTQSLLVRGFAGLNLLLIMFHGRLLGRG